MAIKYFDCKYQGITAGWADTYNIGIPCQWKDVTETPAGSYTLAAEGNPHHILCEGALQCDANDQQIWDDTPFTTCSEGYDPEVCEVAQAARCAPQGLDANGDPLSWNNNPTRRRRPPRMRAQLCDRSAVQLRLRAGDRSPARHGVLLRRGAPS